MNNAAKNLSCFVRRTVNLGAVLIGLALPAGLSAQGYRAIPLVSDLAALAPRTDPNLVNAWGLAIEDNGTLVVCATENSLAGFYRPDGQHVGDYIAVPDDPTGIQINRRGDAFRLFNGQFARPSRLLFVTEEGKILGWNPHLNASEAVVAVDNSATGSVYKGVAIAHGHKGPRLYATNFRGGMVEVYDKAWRPLGTFTDPDVDAGFAPFNIVHMDGLLVVTFAKQEAPDFEDDEPGPGNGFVDLFDLDGELQQRFASRGPLNSPWGIARAPKHFGPFGGAWLIGNFGDGLINAFDPHTGAFLGSLSDAQGNAIRIPGLWALRFGHDEDEGHGGRRGEDHAALYFTAGPGDETHGLIGKIVAERQPH